MSKDLFNKKQPPYICVPITGKTDTEIFAQLEEILQHAPDLIEWRADFFEHLQDEESTINIVHKIKEKANIPLLFTIRAEHEGGEKITLSDDEKVNIITKICRETAVDIVDFETSNERRFVEAVRDAASESKKQLILSYHNFTETPDNEALIDRAKQAETLGANMIKLAVMPKSKADVFRLLEITRKIDEMFHLPIITMSMGEIGKLSRIIGWAFGSIVTFGVGVESSAPGQINVEKLRHAINSTQQLVPSWYEQ